MRVIRATAYEMLQLMLVDGNGLLKAYVFSIEGKMAAGAFRRARN